MTTSDWINLIAAILIGGGTLALAFMTWRSIRQTRGIQKSEKGERLLNEIIAWAETVAGWNYKSYNFIESSISRESWVESSRGEIVSQFQAIEAKGVYINTIILTSFKGFKGKRKLLAAVKAVNKEILELADVSVKRLNKEVAPEVLKEHMDLLRLKTKNLLKEAAKIKTRDIG